MKQSFGIFIVACLFFLSSCTITTQAQAQAQGQELGLADYLKSVMLNNVVSEFAEHFPYSGQRLWVSSAHNAAQNNDVLESLLTKKGYFICKEDDGGVVGVCQSEVSSFLVQLDSSSGVYRTGISVNGKVQVSRFYSISVADEVVPVSSFYVRKKEDVDEPLVEQLKSIPAKQLPVLEEPIKEALAVNVDLVEAPPPVFWQVQVMASVGEAVMLATQKALSKSGVESVVVFEAPFYKLRVGPYFTKQATWAAQKELRKRFAGAFAVKG
jgi:hypothetical protein